MSQKKFSELLNVPYTQLNEILNGKRPVTTDFALMMEAALGINPELLINMQSRYNSLLQGRRRRLLQSCWTSSVPAPPFSIHIWGRRLWGRKGAVCALPLLRK